MKTLNKQQKQLAPACVHLRGQLHPSHLSAHGLDDLLELGVRALGNLDELEKCRTQGIVLRGERCAQG